MKSHSNLLNYLAFSLALNIATMTVQPQISSAKKSDGQSSRLNHQTDSSTAANSAANSATATSTSGGSTAKIATELLQPTVSEEKVGDKTFAVGTITVKAKPEKIWQLLTDYENQPELFSTVKKCQVVENNGAKKLVRQIVCPKGSPMHFDYIVEIDEVAPKLMQWHRKSGALKDVSGSWKLEPDATRHNTVLTYSIYIDGGTFLPAWLLRGQSKHQLPDVLNAIKDAAERASASRVTTGSGAS